VGPRQQSAPGERERMRIRDIPSCLFLSEKQQLSNDVFGTLPPTPTTRHSHCPPSPSLPLCISTVFPSLPSCPAATAHGHAVAAEGAVRPPCVHGPHDNHLPQGLQQAWHAREGKKHGDARRRRRTRARRRGGRGCEREQSGAAAQQQRDQRHRVRRATDAHGRAALAGRHRHAVQAPPGTGAEHELRARVSAAQARKRPQGAGAVPVHARGVLLHHVQQPEPVLRVAGRRRALLVVAAARVQVLPPRAQNHGGGDHAEGGCRGVGQPLAGHRHELQGGRRAARRGPDAVRAVRRHAVVRGAATERGSE
jgi:hypothetical protein